MSALRRIPVVLIVLYVVFAKPYTGFTQNVSRGPAKWWASIDSGLMWSGEETSPQRKGVNQRDAAAYCSTMQIGGISGWRLPTADEMKADTSMQIPDSNVGHIRMFKENAILVTFLTYVWTSTLVGPDSAVTVSFGRPWSMQRHDAIDDTGTFHKTKVTNYKSMGVLCTRQMEPEILQVAKDAQIDFAVPTLQVLKVNGPLRLAREAFESGNYQNCLVQTKLALQIMPNSSFSFWADGLCSAMLGQWDDAISDEEAALRIDKTFRNAEYALKWAKQGKIQGWDANRNNWPTWQGRQD